MIREAPAMTVRQNLGELLNEVQYRQGKVLITKAGKPGQLWSILRCSRACASSTKSSTGCALNSHRRSQAWETAVEALSSTRR